jgi:hypothetical protein
MIDNETLQGLVKKSPSEHETDKLMHSPRVRC